jgi:hypothetical protein
MDLRENSVLLSVIVLMVMLDPRIGVIRYLLWHESASEGK